MAAMIALVTVVPVAVMASVWSDVQSVQETIEKRKLDASNLSMPGDYHTLYDQARAHD
jgi:uncharacterized protein YqgV (UPF0045/DUF77 family)